MNKGARLSPLAEEMAAGLSAFCDALESGEPIGDRFTVRTVSFDLSPRVYRAEDVKALRRTLNASQVIFAKFLGVSVAALRAWERNTRAVPPIACRFMDELVANPDVWTKRMALATQARRREVFES